MPAFIFYRIFNVLYKNLNLNLVLLLIIPNFAPVFFSKLRIVFLKERILADIYYIFLKT